MARFITIPLGLAAGYIVWLVAMSALTFVVPARQLVFAGLIVLAALIVVAAVLAINFSRRGRTPIALGLWCAPILPVLASAYSLFVLLHR